MTNVKVLAYSDSIYDYLYLNLIVEADEQRCVSQPCVATPNQSQMK